MLLALRIFYGACLAGASASTLGQPALSLDEALRLAEANSPRIMAAWAQLAGASAGVVTAGQLPNPDLEATAGGVRARAPGIASGSGTSLSLAQPIEWPSVRRSRIGGAEAGREGSAASLVEVRLELRAAVKQAYHDVIQRKAEFGLALDTESLLEQIRDRIEVRVRVGEAARFELDIDDLVAVARFPNFRRRWV